MPTSNDCFAALGYKGTPGTPGFEIAGTNKHISTDPNFTSILALPQMDKGYVNPPDFNRVKTAFTSFCTTHKDTECDTFLCTGGHGEYVPFKFSGFSKTQIDELTDIAVANNVTFRTVISDCCCATAGLVALQPILAEGGSMYGDSVTSTSLWYGDATNPDPNRSSFKGNYDERMKEAFQDINAPIRIIKDNGDLYGFRFNKQEMYDHMVTKYRNSGLIDDPANKSNQDILTELENYMILDSNLSVDNDYRHAIDALPTLIELDSQNVQRDFLAHASTEELMLEYVVQLSMIPLP